MNLADSPPVWIASTVALTIVFWTLFGTCVGGCIDTPEPVPEPQAKVIATWDPVKCDEPHRVAIELEDEAGRMTSASTNCALGSLTVDARQYGVYLGRVYAWELGKGEGSGELESLVVDTPLVHWQVETPK